MSLANYYQILQVDPNASQLVIDASYVQLQRFYASLAKGSTVKQSNVESTVSSTPGEHAESNNRTTELGTDSQPPTSTMLKELAQAYAVLSDSHQRQRYDLRLGIQQRHYIQQRFPSNTSLLHVTSLQTALAQTRLHQTATRIYLRYLLISCAVVIMSGWMIFTLFSYRSISQSSSLTADSSIANVLGDSFQPISNEENTSGTVTNFIPIAESDESPTLPWTSTASALSVMLEDDGELATSMRAVPRSSHGQKGIQPSLTPALSGHVLPPAGSIEAENEQDTAPVGFIVTRTNQDLPVRTVGDLLRATPTSVPPAGSKAGGTQEFSWQSDIFLAKGDAYEVILWKPGDDPISTGFALTSPTTASSVQIKWDTLNDLLKDRLNPGIYEWGVLIITVEPYTRHQLIRPGTPIELLLDGSSGE
ncbi:MAG: hypothetical protein AAF702_42485 [Chloroflexota bacterium]